MYACMYNFAASSKDASGGLQKPESLSNSSIKPKLKGRTFKVHNDPHTFTNI